MTVKGEGEKLKPCPHCIAYLRMLEYRCGLIKKLEKRIHNQRLALRENWETVESRQKYRQTPLRSMWLETTIKLGIENRNLKKELELERHKA